MYWSNFPSSPVCVPIAVGHGPDPVGTIVRGRGLVNCVDIRSSTFSIKGRGIFVSIETAVGNQVRGFSGSPAMARYMIDDSETVVGAGAESRPSASVGTTK